MAGFELRFDVGGDAREEIQGIVARMRAEEDELPHKFVEAIRNKAAELRDLARDKVLAEPTHSQFHSGLRAKMAAGTHVEDTNDGADVVVSGEGEDERLPYDMDEGGWAHPVWGHRNNWVYQGGYYSWFTETMDNADEPLEEDLDNILDRAIEIIAGR